MEQQIRDFLPVGCHFKLILLLNLAHHTRNNRFFFLLFHEIVHKKVFIVPSLFFLISLARLPN